MKAKHSEPSNDRTAPRYARSSQRRFLHRAWIAIAPLISCFAIVVRADNPESEAPTIAMGNNHGCAIKSDGRAACWGANYIGQLNVPEQLGEVKTLVAGEDHTCAIKSDGTVSCWGSDYHGASTVPSTMGPVRDIAVGSDHACAIKGDGTVQCWGDNTYGQRTPPPGLGAVRAITAGAAHTCAARADGTVECWGFPFGGLFVPAQLGRVRSLSAGAMHTCAVKADSTVECWGDNAKGQLNKPVGLGAVRALSAGMFHTCAVTQRGTVECWGDGSHGQLTKPPLLGTVRAVGAGGAHTCAVKSDGALECWGANSIGQSTSPQGRFGALAVDAGDFHNCAIKSDGAVACWGLDSRGQSRPPAELGPIATVSSGGRHTCVAKADGNASCWGRNDLGQAAPPADLDTVLAVSAGAFHSCAIKSGGAARCWGYDVDGESTVPPGVGPVLGISAGVYHSCLVDHAGEVACWGRNDFGQASPPVGLGKTIAVTSGWQHSCAVKADGTVACWGDNASGQATAPGALDGVRAVSAGVHHTCATKVDGSVTCWGAPYLSSVPAGLRAAGAASAGSYHTCVVDAARSVKCWGDDYHGALGDAPAAPAPAPADAPVGIPYAHAFTSSTGSPPGQFAAAGDLPPGLTLSADGIVSGIPTAAGEFTFVINVSNGVFADASASFTMAVAVADATPPQVVAQVTGVLGGDGWYASDVQVSWTVADPESPVSAMSGCESVTVGADTPGLTLTCTATSGGGTSSGSVTIKRDTTPPILSCDEAPTFSVSRLLLCHLVSGTANDATSGVSAATWSTCADVATVGAKSVSVTVPDIAGNLATVSCPYNVIDPTPPVVVPQLPQAAGLDAWHVGDVQVTWIVNDLQSSISSKEGCDPVTVAADTTGVTLTCAATSAGGTSSASVSIKRDATPPILTCLGAPTFGVGGAGGLVEAAAQDATSGPAAAVVGLPADVSSPGTKTVILEGTDNAGNVSSISCAYVVDPSVTEPGTGVEVQPVDPDPVDPANPSPIEITFDSVTSGGSTTVTSSGTGAPPPSGFKLGSPPTYYEVTTTAQYAESIQVCVTYPGDSYNKPEKERLFHQAAGSSGWDDVTMTGYPVPITDAGGNPTGDWLICGLVTSLSPFAVAEPFEVAGPTAPVAVGAVVTLTAPFNGEWAATWDFGDAQPVPGSHDASSWQGTHAYAQAGIYTARLTLSAATGQVVGTAEYPFIVVYDPSAGFVTGGGWIASPPGAYAPDPALDGRASFGFVSKYQRGATTPSGNTQFQFKAAGLEFHSTGYQWLVVAGARAQFKGIGALNGAGEYNFLLTAIDADVTASDAFTSDRFRLKIWTEDASGTQVALYDNALGDENDGGATPLGGGSIVIHAK